MLVLVLVLVLVLILVPLFLLVVVLVPVLVPGPHIPAGAHAQHVPTSSLDVGDDRDRVIVVSGAVVARLQDSAIVIAPAVIPGTDSDGHRPILELFFGGFGEISVDIAIRLGSGDDLVSIMLASLVFSLVRVALTAVGSILLRPFPVVLHPASLATM